MGSEPQYHGLIELSWTNKDQALIADDNASYQWVPKRDWRVAEVRLLQDAGTVGETRAKDERASDNLLIRGDALHALTSLTQLPEFAADYAGKVKLVYIDPPFNTGQAFAHYDDGLEHSVWLTMMRDRLVQIKDLLASDGSVWVHLDDTEMAYCKVMMDAIFGRENFVATIVWESAPGGRGDTDIASTHDYITVFARDRKAWAKVRNGLGRTATQLGRFQNPDGDPRGPWRQGDDGTAKSGGEDSRWPILLPSGRKAVPKEGRYWAFSKATFEKARAEGRVWFGKNGNSLPVIKRYLSEVNEEVAPKSWWPSTEVGSNQEAKRDHLSKLFPDALPFATPKPERLLERIIHIGSDPGDIVLDCFAGSGTTAAVAHKMGRRWVTSEVSRQTIDTFTAPRLQKVVAGDDPGGVTMSAGWEGGGGFRVLDVAPSMFTEDSGVVVLADGAENGKLSEMVAAQLGFEYDSDPPFCGRRGRMRLAVIDGHVDQAAMRLLARALSPGERLSLAATSLDAEAAELLPRLKRGSVARVIPEDILIAYRAPSAWRASVALASASAVVDVIEHDGQTSFFATGEVSKEAVA